jgi:hypothetical protein
MRQQTFVAALAALAIALGGRPAAASDGSKLSLKLSFGVAGYPSDKDVTTGLLTPVGAVEAGCDSKTSMRYHFDEKFGKTLYGAVCYQMPRSLELELGLGYTDLQMEITQRGEGVAVSPCFVNFQTIYDTVNDSKFRIFTIRPGVSLRPPSRSRYSPCFGLGLDIMMVHGRGNLDFGVPELEHLGLDTYVSTADEPLILDGSETIVGLDVGSGLDVRLAPAVSIEFGFAYTFQFQKAFRDFGGLVSARSNPTAGAADYRFAGMNLNNIAALVSVRFHL